MLYILSEPLFVVSTWYKTILKSLTDELNKKKYIYKIINTDEFYDDNESDYAFLIGTNKSWLDDRIALCMKRSIYPIVMSTQQEFSLNGTYSIVTSNLSVTMKRLISFLNYNGKCRTALFGVNSLSLTNMSILKQFADQKEIEGCVYFNTGSVNVCAEQMVKDIDKYDSVISVNDFATILLIKKLNEAGKNTFLISYGGTRLAKKYYPELMSVSMGYENFGKAAICIMEALRTNPTFDSLTINVQSQFENIDFYNYDNTLISESSDSFRLCDEKFYSDSEINDMIRIENMLLQCDDTDSEILNLLLSGNSYEEISEIVFCALNTVKYRVKKMKENCNCERKNEMIDLIKRYSI